MTIASHSWQFGVNCEHTSAEIQVQKIKSLQSTYFSRLYRLDLGNHLAWHAKKLQTLGVVIGIGASEFAQDFLDSTV